MNVMKLTEEAGISIVIGNQSKSQLSLLLNLDIESYTVSRIHPMLPSESGLEYSASLI